MSERAHLNKSEPAHGQASELAKPDHDRVVAAALQLWIDGRAELFGTPSRQRIKDELTYLARCGEHPSVNTPLPLVLKTLDLMDDRTNGTKAGRPDGLPRVELFYGNSDNPSKPPLKLMFTRTESSPSAALHGILPFMRIPGSAYDVPRSVPGGSGDVCVPPGPKPHHKALAPWG
jgi:hypothetical protein